MARLQLRAGLRNPLNAVFGVDSNVVVLRELVRHGGALAASQIVERSGASKSSIRLGLIALESLDLVISEGTRSTRLHRFNRQNYFAPMIETLFEAETQRFPQILDAIREIAASLPQILSLSLFGSVATGTDRPESDLDLLVVATGSDLAETVQSLREGLRPAARIFGFTPNVIGLSSDDVLRLSREHDPWWNGALSQLVMLAGQHPASLPREQGRRGHG